MKITSGTINAHSRRLRSRNPRFSSCVTSPKITRWYIHSRYTAAKMTPVMASAARPRFVWNAPIRIRNSPTNPLRPGNPRDDSTTTRKRAEKVIPAFSALFLVVVLSSLGLPGLNGFVGEFLILIGAFQTNRGLAALAMTGVIFAAVYLLWMYQRVIFGEVTHEENRGLRDLSLREWALIVPLVIFIVWIGFYPTVFTGPTEATVEALIAQVQSKASVA